ncbi:Flp family type IVb pilin [Vibrio europaeus]|uniref:Fimbrial protein n=1 Tax=Vibrio europaeus TaxID=300876 RepID=A0A178JBF3_9VIBR|nr:fimbrial protein [Vibrio europaeus]MDC5703307.1 Flp family type IVb pilin [Vibrio europaeus]MDC5711538.1 Flp family type IVb pilin [Vibrio europaeus]MDC5715031.1 Flp family type IVb pilin [Vibrio europaeus]MDC5722031.1 Flp family type IVb pilin [Vibrio europaeus]MDC5727649.1 Flp family type IVb pilin [Vibrio europaeus]
MSANNCIQRFIEDEEGLTVVEYVVGAGALALAMGSFFGAFDDILVAEISSIFSG